MKLTEIKEMAKGMGVNPGKLNKAQLIREIQSQEGNVPCFDTAVKDCDQMNCLWREDCMPG
jgi:hypothetical protein